MQVCSWIKFILSKNTQKTTRYRAIFLNLSVGFTTTKLSYDLLDIKDEAEWRKWLDKNHSTIPGIWLKIYKKSVAGNSIKYDEALDQALCYGWIDGQRKKYDETAFLQKFTPRRQRSSWSHRNINIVKRLEQQGKIMPPGKAQIEKAKKKGRWGN